MIIYQKEKTEKELLRERNGEEIDIEEDSLDVSDSLLQSTSRYIVGTNRKRTHTFRNSKPVVTASTR